MNCKYVSLLEVFYLDCKAFDDFIGRDNRNGLQLATDMGVDIYIYKNAPMGPKKDGINFTGGVGEEDIPKIDLDDGVGYNKGSGIVTSSGVNPIQKEIIENITDPKTQLVHPDNPNYHNLKGNYGKMKTDIDLESNGYKRVSNDRCTDLNAQTKQGIDGVYQNSNPLPEWIIDDSKYVSGKKGTRNAAPSLGKTKFGNQLSNKRIERNINKAVDEKTKLYPIRWTIKKSPTCRVFLL